MKQERCETGRGWEVRTGSGRNWGEDYDQNTLYGYVKFSRMNINILQKELMAFTLPCPSIQPPSVNMVAHIHLAPALGNEQTGLCEFHANLSKTQ